jgi:hypothetical protein
MFTNLNDTQTNDRLRARAEAALAQRTRALREDSADENDSRLVVTTAKGFRP